MRYTKKDILSAAKKITKWLSGKSESHKVIDMNDTVKIVVLDDGSTWAGEAEIYTITREAYNKMLDTGLTPDNLDPDDIIDSVSVYDSQQD
jgi:hypothetical protein